MAALGNDNCLCQKIKPQQIFFQFVEVFKSMKYSI